MPPKGFLQLITLVFLCLIIYDTSALKTNVNFTDICQERLTELQGIYNQSLSQEELNQYKCGQKFKDSPSPAPSINISLEICLAKAPGYQRSDELSQWATPLFGFLLPAAAFVLTIGRPARLPKFEWLIFLRQRKDRNKMQEGRLAKMRQFLWGGLMLVSGLLLTMVSVILDTMLWGIAVFVFAGPLIAGTIYKAANDYSILRHLQRKIEQQHPIYGLERYLVAVVLVGTFKIDTNGLGERVRNALKDPKEASEKLLHLVNQIPSFGGPIFGPVLFFLGAFVWSLFDARDRQGDNDTANAIAFGIWYGTIIVVAILSAATMGVENPFTIENVFGRRRNKSHHRRGESISVMPAFIFSLWHRYSHVRKEITEEEKVEKKPLKVRVKKAEEDEEDEIPFSYFDDAQYVTVWLGRRHISFRRWMKEAEKFPEQEKSTFFQHLLSGWRRRTFAVVAAITIISIPCALALTTSYYTPTVGFGCRSVTVFTYLISQLMLIISWLIDPDDPTEPHPMRRTFNLVFIIIASLGGAFATVGGTVMQLLGVYRNCICKAGFGYATKPAKGVVELATDTKFDRDKWTVWWSNGISALVFFSTVLLFACFYNMWMKENCKTIVDSKEFKTEWELELEQRKIPRYSVESHE